MSELREFQKELNGIRAQIEKQKHFTFVSSQQLNRNNREIEAAKRNFESDNPEHISRQKKLEATANTIKRELANWQRSVDKLTQAEADLFDKFNKQFDPRKTLSQFTDDYPFLLFPVRVEYRFKEIKNSSRTSKELWLRVYPDDCNIDTFEPVLSESEITSLRQYWSSIWQAGGSEGVERGAWRSLVASHGTGRSIWLVEQYKPKNPSDKPNHGSEQDIVLLIVVHEIPDASEKESISEFWTEMVRAGGNVDIERSVFQNLQNEVGEDRANEIVKTLKPDNYEMALSSDDGNQLNTAFLHLPEPSEVDSKLASWTQAPTVKSLPDRFVVTAYKNGKVVRSQLLQPVKYPLYVGIDPSTPIKDQLSHDKAIKPVFCLLCIQLQSQSHAAIDIGIKVKQPLHFIIYIEIALILRQLTFNRSRWINPHVQWVFDGLK